MEIVNDGFSDRFESVPDGKVSLIASLSDPMTTSLAGCHGSDMHDFNDWPRLRSGMERPSTERQ